MLQYISRKKTLINDLEKAECPLPSQFKGYMLLRDARLPQKTLDTWSHGDYDYDVVACNLRKLERTKLTAQRPATAYESANDIDTRYDSCTGPDGNIQ